MKHLLIAVLAWASVLPQPVWAQDAITFIAPGGDRAAMEALIPGFEKSSGRKVNATFGSGLGTKKQVAEGDPFDVFVVQPPYPDVLASGNVVEKSAVTLASVAVGVAVKKGAPHPDISTPAAVKRALLAASSITYPDPKGGAAAGVSFEKTLAMLGIADQVAAKVKRAQGGAGAMQLVAKGEVEIGLTFMSEMQDPGIDVLGPLPREISTPTVLVGFVSAHAKDGAAAQALLNYLSSPSAAAIYKAHGMTPGGS